MNAFLFAILHVKNKQLMYVFVSPNEKKAGSEFIFMESKKQEGEVTNHSDGHE